MKKRRVKGMKGSRQERRRRSRIESTTLGTRETTRSWARLPYLTNHGWWDSSWPVLALATGETGPCISRIVTVRVGSTLQTSPVV